MLWIVFSNSADSVLLGRDFHVAGTMIHLLLALATIGGIVNLLGGRPVAVTEPSDGVFREIVRRFVRHPRTELCL